jgi:predicted RNA-binding Zn-ribbon protein involved in translation (DUF1610 family)
MEEFNTKETATNQELKCKNCASVLKFKPGTNALKCESCGVENIIESSQTNEKIEEVDFVEFIENKLKDEEKIDVATVKCTSCGAISSMKPNVTSDSCPFCGVSLVLSSGSTSSVLKPKSLLPFKIEQKTAMELFRKWVRKLWFAPNALKTKIQNIEKLVGIYIPYWTYDSNTTSRYSGERGTYYYTTESYTTTENGQSVTKTRQVRHTRWSSVSGTVAKFFDDIMVLASKSLPKKYADALEPWDLQNLTPFNEKYLSGFKTESYQVDVKTGFEEAKTIMDKAIRQLVLKDIGGDEQRIHSVSTSHSNITFKHVLLPIWISAYKFKNKVYRFLVNARTGEVQGERPWSWIKITLLILTILAIIVGAIWLYNSRN